MSNSLSVRQQERLITALDNLIKSERIHKKDINTLHNIMKRFDKVEVSIELMARMGPSVRDSTALKNTFSQLFSKLENQHSAMQKDKQTKLNNIQQKLMPIIESINYDTIKDQQYAVGKQLSLVNNEICSSKNKINIQQEIVSEVEGEIKRLKTEIESITKVLMTIPQSEFAAKDAQRLTETKAEISKLVAKQHNEIRAIKSKITEQENSRAKLLNFAKEHNVARADKDLTRAESGAIYDYQDMGFGTTSWREHLASDEYAIKNFGYVQQVGRRQYSDLVKKPNQAGKQWQKLMKNYNQAPKNIEALTKELRQLKSTYEAQIDKLKFNNRLSAKEEILQDINKKNALVNALQDEKKAALAKIESAQGWLIKQEAEQKTLTELLASLETQLK